jgi:hypothetical protein
MATTADTRITTITRTYESKGETRTYEQIVVVLPVTVAGRTQDVEFSFFDLDRSGHSKSIFTGHIGRGDKTHKTEASSWCFATEADAKRKGYRGSSLVEVDGHWFGIQLIGMRLNRQVRITGWVADAEATSAHIMER